MAKYDLDTISVKSPCNESWDEMSGNDEIRFCSHCAQSVHNLSTLNRAEIEKLIERSNGRLCVRYVKTSQGKLIAALPENKSQIKRQRAIAARILASSLAFSTVAYAQSTPVSKNSSEQTQVDNARKINPTQKNSMLSGVVNDASGAVVPGARITLRNTKTNEFQIALSSDEGFYEFKKVEPAVYQIEIEKDGFIKAIHENVEVLNGMKLEMPFSLEVGGATVGILMIVDLPVELTPSKPLDKIDSIKPIPVLEVTNPKKKKRK